MAHGSIAGPGAAAAPPPNELFEYLAQVLGIRLKVIGPEDQASLSSAHLPRLA